MLQWKKNMENKEKKKLKKYFTKEIKVVFFSMFNKYFRMEKEF